MDSIVIVATIIAKDGHTQLVKSELNKLLIPTREESGNISYKIHQDLQNEHKFVAVEEWRDGSAIKAHMAADHVKAYGMATSEAIESFDYVTLSEITA